MDNMSGLEDRMIRYSPDTGGGGGGKDTETDFTKLSYVEFRNKLKNSKSPEEQEILKDEKFRRAVAVSEAGYAKLDQPGLEGRLMDILSVSTIDTLDANLSALALNMENEALGSNAYQNDLILKGSVYDIVRGEADAVRLGVYLGMTDDQLIARGLNRKNIEEERGELDKTRLGLANVRGAAGYLQAELTEDELKEYALRQVPGAENAYRLRVQERLVQKAAAKKAAEEVAAAAATGGSGEKTNELPTERDAQYSLVRGMLRNLERTAAVGQDVATRNLVKQLKEFAESPNIEEGLANEIKARIAVWRIAPVILVYQGSLKDILSQLNTIRNTEGVEINELTVKELLKKKEPFGLNVYLAWNWWEAVNNPDFYRKVVSEIAGSDPDFNISSTDPAPNYFLDTAENQSIVKEYLVKKLCTDHKGGIHNSAEERQLAIDSLNVAWSLMTVTGELSVFNRAATRNDDKLAKIIHMAAYRSKRASRFESAGPESTKDSIKSMGGSWFRLAAGVGNQSRIEAQTVLEERTMTSLASDISYSAYWVSVLRFETIFDNMIKLDWKPADVTSNKLGDLLFAFDKCDKDGKIGLKKTFVHGLLAQIATHWGEGIEDTGWNSTNFRDLKDLLLQNMTYTDDKGIQQTKVFISEKDFQEVIKGLGISIERELVKHAGYRAQLKGREKPVTDGVGQAVATAAKKAVSGIIK